MSITRENNNDRGNMRQYQAMRCKDCTSFELEIGLNRLVWRSPIVSFELPIVVRRARSVKRLLLAVYLPYLDSQSDFSLFFVPLFDI